MNPAQRYAARREELASQAQTTLLVARVLHAARQLEHEEFSARDLAWFRRPIRGGITPY